MKVEITGGGFYNSEGKEIAPGTIVEFKKEPTALAGRYRVVGRAEQDASDDSKPKGKFNPDKATEQELLAHLEERKIPVPEGATKGDLVALAKKG